MNIPQPYHRWAANEGLHAPKAFSMKDRCLTCGVPRMSHLSGVTGVWINSVAAGACPERDWRELTEAELAPYVIAYVDEPQTPTQRAMLDAAQRTQS